MRFLQLLPVLMVLVLLIPSVPAQEDEEEEVEEPAVWSTFHGGNTRDGVSDQPFPDKGALFWEFVTDDPIWSSPAIADERIFFGSDDNFIYCVDIPTGQEVWTRQLRVYMRIWSWWDPPTGPSMS